jgi:hypothetical protein
VAAGADGSQQLPPPPAQPSGYPCGGDAALTKWITLPAVKAALHVAPNAAYHSADNGVGFVYNLTYASALPLMRRLQTGVDGIRVLAVNGATDPGISVIRTSNWTYGLDFPVEEAWRPWVQSNTSIVLGHVVRWQGDFVQATVCVRGQARGAAPPLVGGGNDFSFALNPSPSPPALLFLPPPSADSARATKYQRTSPGRRCSRSTPGSSERHGRACPILDSLELLQRVGKVGIV